MSHLPKGFVYLEDVDSTILQDIRYATHYNFIGRPLIGYSKPRCVVSEKLAFCLKDVQKIALKDNYILKVYDGYRPLRAVEDIVFWSGNPSDTLMKPEFYAHLAKNTLFKEGYIGVRSFHTRGAAVDVTLVPNPPPHQRDFILGEELYDGTLPKERRFPDNTIDMGTSFDCFHHFSHTNSLEISKQAQENRKRLCNIMHGSGFVNYELEWWHFNLKEEPFPETYFDFEIL